MLTDSDLDAMDDEARRCAAAHATSRYGSTSTVESVCRDVLALTAEVRRLRGAPVIECETLPHLNPPVTIFRERLPGAATT